MLTASLTSAMTIREHIPLEQGLRQFVRLLLAYDIDKSESIFH